MRIMRPSNQKVLFGLRLFKHITGSFIDTFFVLYFLESSRENILPLGIYQIIMVATVYLTIYGLRNLARTKHRVRLMRVAMVLDLAYFLLIIMLQTRVPEFAYLLGFLRGLEEGFYYSVYNVIESDGVKNSERAKFLGFYRATAETTSIIMPVVFGTLIYGTGFADSVVVILIIVAGMIALSLMFKDKNIPAGRRTSIRKYRAAVRGDGRFRRLNTMAFFYGLVVSSSALSQIVTIYVVSVFSDSLSLGIFTGIFGAVTGIFGILYAKVFKPRHYAALTWVTSALMAMSLVLMVIECNLVTVVLLKFWRTMSATMIETTFGHGAANLCNDPKVKRRYKVEFYVNLERYIVSGRVLSNVFFIAMAFMASWVPVLLLFGGLTIGMAWAAVRFQKALWRQRPRKPGAELAPALRVAEDGEE